MEIRVTAPGGGPAIEVGAQPRGEVIRPHDRQHNRILVEKLIARNVIAGQWEAEDWIARLCGTVDEPRITVGHPNPDDETSLRPVMREHAIDEGIDLVTDPSGPEAQLRARVVAAEVARKAREEAAAQAEQERRREAAQVRWNGLSQVARALTLVAARTADPQRGDVQAVNSLELRKRIAADRRDVLLSVAAALDEVSGTVPDEVIELFNKGE